MGKILAIPIISPANIVNKLTVGRNTCYIKGKIPFIVFSRNPPWDPAMPTAM